MKKTMEIFYAITILAVLIFVLERAGILKVPQFSQEEEKLPFSKKKYLLTEADLKFFRALQQAAGDKFYIFPQVHLPNLFFINKKGRDWWKAFGTIKQKSIDFLLCDPQFLTPVLGIELNDSSHKREDRSTRDRFVNNVFEDAKLPLLTIPCAYSYDINQLRVFILEKIDSI